MKETPFIPITRNFDQSPIGYVDLSEGRCKLKLNEKFKILQDEINSGRLVFAPSYMITKVNQKTGIVVEVELDSFSLITGKI